MEPSLNILALNSGSSSLKFGLYRVGPDLVETRFSGHDEVSDPARAMGLIADLLARDGGAPPDAIGHRIVHGGPKLRSHCLIDEDVLRDLEGAAPFAPLHLPQALAIIKAADVRFPSVPRAACFDTAFHRDMPLVSRVLPIPRHLRAEGVERYGFHGLSCESIVRQLASRAPARFVIAHLGAGASVTAVKDGGSIDTSMGLTPSGGMIMGTRSGDLDPGLLVYLMREQRLDAAGLEDLVDRRSGLAGISGIGGDMRRLHEAAETNPDARLSIEMFCYSARKQIAAMIAALGGADLIVFTGGIGENDEVVRRTIRAGLDFAGVGRVSCPVIVLPSREDEEIARHTWSLLRRGPRPDAA